MNKNLSNLTKALIYLVASFPVVLVSLIAFVWMTQIQLNKNARDLSNGLNEGLTTSAELFRIKRNEFICFEPIHQNSPSKTHNYNAIFKAGLTIENIPNYNKWPFEMVFWDPDDIRVMALSTKGKLRRIHLMANSYVSTDKWPHHFGCFDSSHAIKITFKGSKNNKGMTLEFPDVPLKTE